MFGRKVIVDVFPAGSEIIRRFSYISPIFGGAQGSDVERNRRIFQVWGFFYVGGRSVFQSCPVHIPYIHLHLCELFMDLPGEGCSLEWVVVSQRGFVLDQVI